jgi:HPr kinase/phosphorylase
METSTPERVTRMQSVQDLFERLGSRLKLRWLNDGQGHHNPLRGEAPITANQTLVGTLNCIHPNRIQVIGQAEALYLADLGPTAYLETVEKLFADQPAAIVFSEAIEPAADFYDWARETCIALLGSSLGDQELIANLQYFLTHALAERSTVHGVLLEVFSMGVLLTGDASIGKSELALDLICRGHRLIADDVPEFARIAPDTLHGSCPPLLADFLEVRGLGVLNIRAMFGDSAVRRKKELNLVVDLQRLNDAELAALDRLSGSLSTRNILEVPVPQVTIPVAPGRNMAILVEAAVRHQILRLNGYDASVDFTDRQAQLLTNMLPGAETHA